MNLHLKSLYIPQEVFDYHYCYDHEQEEEGGGEGDKTPLDVVMGYKKKNQFESKETFQKRIEELENELELLMERNNEDERDHDPNDDENYEAEMERICNEIALLEEQDNDNGDDDDDDGATTTTNSEKDEQSKKASQVLSYFGIDQEEQLRPMRLLSGGQKKKVLLACALFCDIDILLLDGAFDEYKKG